MSVSGKPKAYDLFCGLGGWTEGLLDAGFDVTGYDIEDHRYGDLRYPGKLILQDVRTINGRDLADAKLIVASPPCQRYSYMAMPWRKAKELSAWYSDPEHPERIAELNELFNACFRIQREASEAAGRHVPMVVENVRGAQKWVGRARYHYGSYYLWGDVPAIMPDSKSDPFARKLAVMKLYRSKIDIKNKAFTHHNDQHDGWYERNNLMRRVGSKSPTRKFASAVIAKIPYRLARYIGDWYFLS